MRHAAPPRGRHLAPEPPRRRPDLLSRVLLVAGVALLLVAAGMFLYTQWGYWRQDRVNEELAAFAEVSDDASRAPQVDWDALKAVNDDVVAWLQIPGTPVNYPVYQGEDNDYYLEYTAYGEPGVGGHVFLDDECRAPGMRDAQTVLFGHNLRNGAMFRTVANMDDQEAFDAVDTVWYVTEDEAFELEPLLVYYTQATDQDVRTFSFTSDEEREAYLTGLLEDSVVAADDAAAAVADAEHVLTLCTCNYIEGEGRTILVCVPKGEVSS